MWNRHRITLAIAMFWPALLLVLGANVGCFLLIDLDDRQADASVDAAPPDASTACEPTQTEPCYTGPSETQDQGVCHAGTRTCQAGGTWGGCDGEVTPATQCDGRECGSDGCAGSCGTCENGVDCIPESGRCDRGTMALVPDGVFDMGSLEAEHGQSLVDEEQHEIELTKAFEIERTEVTNQAYLQCVTAGLCDPPTSCASGQPIWFSAAGFPTEVAHHPVVCLSWEMAAAYCDFAGKRLCTEAEWERACVYSSRHRAYPWGDEWPTANPALYANCEEGYCFDGHAETSPVGTFLAGQTEGYLHDMGGNVSEWVSDWYSPTYYATGAQTDPAGPCPGELPCTTETGITAKVHRGGNWFFEKDYLRCSRRAFRIPSQQERFLGVRCCRDATDL